MRTPILTWGGFVKIFLSALLAATVLDVPAITRDKVGHLAVLFLLVAAFRSLIETLLLSRERLAARRTPPEA